MTQTETSFSARAAGPVGPLMALLSFALYATHDVLIRILGESYSVFQIMFFMGLLSFPFLVLMLIRDPEPGTLRAVHPYWSLTRTFCVVASAGGAFYAFTTLPLAQVYAMLFASPLLITLLSIPLLGEKVGLHRGAAVIVGLLGVIVVLRPGGTELGLGHLAALGAAALAALNSVIVRKIGADERSAVLLLYPMLANVGVMACLLPVVYVPIELPHLAMVVVVAALAFAAMLLSIGAYRRSEAALVAPMQYSQIIWATLFGAVLFGESPDLWTIVGAGLIVASGLYIVFRESRRNVSENQPVLQTRLRGESVAAPAPMLMEELQAEPEEGAAPPHEQAAA